MKMPRIEIFIRGDIPGKLMSVLHDEYCEQVRLSEDN